MTHLLNVVPIVFEGKKSMKIYEKWSHSAKTAIFFRTRLTISFGNWFAARNLVFNLHLCISSAYRISYLTLTHFALSRGADGPHILHLKKNISRLISDSLRPFIHFECFSFRGCTLIYSFFFFFCIFKWFRFCIHYIKHMMVSFFNVVFYI